MYMELHPQGWKPSPELEKAMDELMEYLDWLEENPEEEKKAQEEYRKWLEEQESNPDWELDLL